VHREFGLLTRYSSQSDDSPELSLSEFQLDVFEDWKRPAEAMPPPAWRSSSLSKHQPSMAYVLSMDLVQDAATDCSVVASLCAGAERVLRGHTPLLKTIMWPWDDLKNEPHLSENGKYVFRLNFNGCFRKVIIDDRIPASATDRVIHVVDRNNPALLWPALVEKAYLKVRGGYDFPGSNSGTDLWILTGWIPEQVFLQADDLEPDRFWQRILKAFTYGDVMITMGTGKMSRKTERALGLASEHDYAVLDLREVDGQHLMLIKNPWLSGMAWSGRETSAVDTDPDPVSSPRDLLNKDDDLKPGTFWMDLDNVLRCFESIYLNWNPGLFSFRQDVHFEWDLTETPDVNGARKPRGPFASLQNHRQFAVSIQKPGNIWLLLWRHFQNTVPEAATPDEIESGRHFIDLTGYMALASFNASGRRVMLPERHHRKGWFVDSPQTLLMLEDCEAETSYTIVALEQNLAAVKHSFTISAFSTSPLTIADAAPRYPHSTLLPAAWTSDTAGGNSQAATYCSNPQFILVVTQKTSISLLLETPDKNLNVHVRLLHGISTSPAKSTVAGSEQRVHRICRRDIVTDSKDYRAGACLCEVGTPLDPGNYIILCSTFEAGQTGPFTLLVESSQPVHHVSLLPREGAGRIRTVLDPVDFERGQNARAVRLEPQRLTTLYAIARPISSLAKTTTQSSPRSHLRLSLRYNRGPDSILIATSNEGEYADGRHPIRTEIIDLAPLTSTGSSSRSGGDRGLDWQGHQQPRECWLVLERMHVHPAADTGDGESFGVELSTDSLNGVSYGRWIDWQEG
jgi:hypothetical protein